MSAIKTAKHKVPRLVFTVEWDASCERYVVFDNDRDVACHSCELHVAIKGGRVEANRLRDMGRPAAVMVKDRASGALREEYVTNPVQDAAAMDNEVRYPKQSRWRRSG